MSSQQLTQQDLLAELNAITEAEVANETTEVEVKKEAVVEQPTVEEVQPVAEPVTSEEKQQEEQVAKEVEVVKPTKAKKVDSLDDVELLNAELTKELQKQKDEGIKRETIYNELKSLMENLLAEVTEKNKENNQARIANLISKHDFTFDESVTVEELDRSNPIRTDSKLGYVKRVLPQAAYPVICLKSGYRVWLAPLTNNEKIEVRNLLNNTQFDMINGLLKVVHRKIVDSSLGKMSFQEFLNKTADEDFETLVFGVFAATYPKPVEYTIKCPKCGESNTVKVSASQLVEAVDFESTGTYIQELLAAHEQDVDFTPRSLLNTSETVQLNDSKIVLKVRTPSLAHMQRTNNLYKQFDGIYENDLIQVLKFIPEIYVPDLEAIAQGRKVFLRVNDHARILKLLNEVSTSDLAQARSAAVKRAARYMLDYRIARFNCAKCGEEIKDVPVDMLTLLFTSIGNDFSV